MPCRSRRKKQPNLDKVVISEESKAAAYAHVQGLDDKNSLYFVDSNYVKAFNNPPFAKFFMDVFAKHMQSKGLNIPYSIQRLIDNPELLYVVEEPYDD